MPADALSVLRRNLASIAEDEAICAALREGTLAEAVRFGRRTTDAAALFRSVSGQSLCSPEFAEICRALHRGVTDPEALGALLPDFVADDGPTDTRTAYLRNAYTDRAFAAFSRHIERLSAQYQPSFAAGCEEVYNSRCSYCILPIRNSEDGTLTSFSRMIAKYDLKIARVTDVAIQDSDVITRYALLRRGLDLHVPEKGILQATIVLPENIAPGAFFLACEYTGAHIDAVTTIPLRYTSDVASFAVCFQVDHSSAAPLLCFLSTALESCTFDGLYSTQDP